MGNGWLALVLGVYLAAGVLMVATLWWSATEPLELGWGLLFVWLWPVIVFGLLVWAIATVQIPARSDWQERRRLAAEKRALPGEVVPHVD